MKSGKENREGIYDLAPEFCCEGSGIETTQEQSVYSFSISVEGRYGWEGIRIYPDQVRAHDGRRPGLVLVQPDIQHF
jgi:hypothetical protein